MIPLADLRTECSTLFSRLQDVMREIALHEIVEAQFAIPPVRLSAQERKMLLEDPEDEVAAQNKLASESEISDGECSQ